MKRHVDNFEGAFPLLLIGTVLVVYAGILASQQIGSHSSHLPLWGLFGGMGAVIVGAGIYSTFLEPPVTSGAHPSEERVIAPKTEWKSSSKARAPPEGTRSPPGPVPIWWEGPPPPEGVPPSQPTGAVSTARLDSQPAPTGSLVSQNRPVKPARVVPRTTTAYSYRELSDELTELEALVYGTSGARVGTKTRTPVPGGLTTFECVDCDRPLTTAALANPCRGCGRGLCAPCATLSRSEDGEVRCTDCRARAA